MLNAKYQILKWKPRMGIAFCFNLWAFCLYLLTT